MTVASEEAAEPLGKWLRMHYYVSYHTNNQMALFSHLDTWIWLRRAVTGVCFAVVSLLMSKKAEVNTVLIKSSVDINLEGIASQAEAQMTH